jgi:hypothetical protein
MAVYPFGSICSVWLGHSFHGLLRAPTILPLARPFPRLYNIVLYACLALTRRLGSRRLHSMESYVMSPLA